MSSLDTEEEQARTQSSAGMRLLCPDTVIHDRFRLEREIGHGAAGSVWRAERSGWGGSVAIKFLLPRGGSESDVRALARFRREVQLCAQLRSPHVVHIMDHGVHELSEGLQLPFLVMELLEGESLARRIKRRHTLPPKEALAIVTQIGRALTTMHRAGVVHRDLKPDNLFVCANADSLHIKLVDFGLAKLLAESELDVTQPGCFVGTPLYASPEQLDGEGVRDHRADLWSLAVITAECLTGWRLFEPAGRASLEALRALCDNPPIPSQLGKVPAGFDAWFAKAVARDVEQRFHSAQELVDALRPICAPGLPRETMSAVPLHSEPDLADNTQSIDGVANTHGESDGAGPVRRRRPLRAAAVLGGALAAGLWYLSTASTSVTASTAPQVEVAALAPHPVETHPVETYPVETSAKSTPASEPTSEEGGRRIGPPLAAADLASPRPASFELTNAERALIEKIRALSLADEPRSKEEPATASDSVTPRENKRVASKRSRRRLKRRRPPAPAAKHRPVSPDNPNLLRIEL